ncbi:hypothetical protein M513_05254 [Trichuris suis]|uniref:Uncharacterized protein n=1 Tax=Trichuris suis TaxID=68888 RepID=A0A085M9U1_9BILA|nr:hypothetical protein M513_05254 [Trichuris suis]
MRREEERKMHVGELQAQGHNKGDVKVQYQPTWCAGYIRARSPTWTIPNDGTPRISGAGYSGFSSSTTCSTLSRLTAREDRQVDLCALFWLTPVLDSLNFALCSGWQVELCAYSG